MNRVILQPGTDHPISFDYGVAVRVELGGRVIADKADALMLKEANYPKVAYIDPDAFASTQFEPSTRRTWCPYKGEADYFSWLASDGSVITDVMWRYANPHPAVAEIAGRFAFYSNQAKITAV